MTANKTTYGRGPLTQFKNVPVEKLPGPQFDDRLRYLSMSDGSIVHFIRLHPFILKRLQSVLSKVSNCNENDNRNRRKRLSVDWAFIAHGTGMFAGLMYAKKKNIYIYIYILVEGKRGRTTSDD